MKARVLQPNGEYVRAAAVGAHTGTRFSAQDYLMGVAMGAGVKVPGSKGHEAKVHEPKVHAGAEKVVAAKADVNGAGKSVAAKV